MRPKAEWAIDSEAIRAGGINPTRVVLFVEPVPRTAVFVSLQLARGPRAVFDFATRMSERTIRQHRCEKRSLNFTKIRYRRKTFQPNNRNYR